MIAEKYKTAKSRLILLDYDGTLADFSAIPDEAYPHGDALALLQKLAAMPHTKLAIVSGRGSESIDYLFPDMPIDIIAEHGAMIKQFKEWKQLVSDDGKWKASLLEVLDKFTKMCPGAFVEEKRFGLAWHYRNCNEQQGIDFSRQLIHELTSLAEQFHLKITDANKVVEINSKRISKAVAVDYFLSLNSFDYILCIGDDKTDEDMFHVLSGNRNAFTIKVGEGMTFAKYRVKSVEDVINLLRVLSI
ncbi:MAG: trehalose-phosphatase [Chitinophagales bacterium]